MKNLIRLVSLSTILLLTPLVWAQDEDEFAKVKIETIQVRDNIYMLLGQGGNIGVSAGEDGVYIIDDQFAPLTEKIKNAIAKLSDKPIRFVINTHWHFDHTGGNENLGNDGSIIIANDNVYTRMNQESFVAAFNRTMPPSPKAALPIITFNDTMTLHLNGEDAVITHVGNAHTDGDSFIHFKKSNVIHTGDLWFNGLYPFIDASSNGSIDGAIKAVGQVLAVADDNTKIIPGHGPLGDKAALKQYRSILITLRDRMRKLMDEGKTLEEIKALKPNAADYDETLGKGFLSPDRFLEILYSVMDK